MNRCSSHSWLVPVLALFCSWASNLSAQTFKALHSFNASDGANPYGGLVLSTNTLYGTTTSGGDWDGGTVFALNTDGTGFRTVNGFTNSEGVIPFAGLILSGNTLYGTTSFSQFGASSGSGTIFSVHTDGTGFTNLHNFTTTSFYLSSFTNIDGANPEAALVLYGDTLYGTAPNGGSLGSGTLFSVKTDGTGFTVLHAFTATSTNSSGAYTNSDGANLLSGLTLSGNTVYGTAYRGGSYGNGTVFSVHTDGTGFTILHSFAATFGVAGVFGNGTNSDGVNPMTGLTLSGNTLYGTTGFGGSYGNGTVFSIHTDGTAFANLHDFTAIFPDSYTNADGGNPQSELILSGNTMFGSARLGGRSGNGTVFALNIDGTDFTTLHDFAAASFAIPHTNTDGFEPSGGLVLSSNVLYGTARYGGSYSGNNNPYCNGTIFSISLPASPPQLTVTSSGDNLILAWPTNHAGIDYSGYILQSTADLDSRVWTTNLPAPVVINGQYTVTNRTAGTQQFFRLTR